MRNLARSIPDPRKETIEVKVEAPVEVPVLPPEPEPLLAQEPPEEAVIEMASVEDAVTVVESTAVELPMPPVVEQKSEEKRTKPKPPPKKPKAADQKKVKNLKVETDT